MLGRVSFGRCCQSKDVTAANLRFVVRCTIARCVSSSFCSVQSNTLRPTVIRPVVCMPCLRYCYRRLTLPVINVCREVPSSTAVGNPSVTEFWVSFEMYPSPFMFMMKAEFWGVRSRCPAVLRINFDGFGKCLEILGHLNCNCVEN
ncbi:unnamed protein product [Citrullus colocynthis]|uniref:Uncharacterized protein n=1 Tax=Citrullus colocynthis TaxID=252529 RepID=A0ABP0XSI0_9ROSI